MVTVRLDDSQVVGHSFAACITIMLRKDEKAGQCIRSVNIIPA
jgi:hypothetical protein